MGIHTQGRSVGSKGGFAILPAALLVACVAIGLVVPALAPAAAKERSTIYSAFTKCPTNLPLMNDPSTESAACFSNVSRFGSAKIGFIDIPFSSPARMQFAVAGVEAGVRGEEGFVRIVPGTTSLESDPVLIPNPFASQVGDPPAAPGGSGSGSSQSQSPAPQAPTPPAAKKVKKKQKKQRRHHRKGKHKKAAKKGAKGKNRHRIVAFRGAQLNAAPASKISISVELAGDVEEFNLLVAGGETPGTAMKLPMVLHLEGIGLGSDCNIGTLADPIVVTGEKVKPESALIMGLNDPNGFPVRVFGSSGSKLEDSTLAIPAVNGCGSNAEALNEYMGLPAAPGSSRMVFSDNLFEFVEAGYDGVGLEGGAELQAAFDAAR